MNFACEVCHKTFAKKANLTRHLQRKDPCNIVIDLQCKRCKKIFQSQFHLDRHNNRKKECAIIELNSPDHSNNRTELSKEKTKQYELKLKEKELDKQRELEKTKQLELKIKEKELEIHAQKELKLLEIQAQKELKLLEIEALKLRNESRIKEEEMKTERKEKTTHVINNIETINIQNNFIQQINMTYVTDKVLCLETQNFNKTIDVIYKRKIDQENDFNIYLFNNSKSIRDFISTFLKMIFNTEKFINMKCLFYNKELDKFFGIFQNPETKEVRQIDYEKYIDCLFRPLLIELFKNIEQYCKETKENTDPNDIIGYTKYIDITSGRSVTLKSLENMSKDILYDGYILSKDDYNQIIVKYNKGIKLHA